jgi:hypothetical protein
MKIRLVFLVLALLVPATAATAAAPRHGGSKPKYTVYGSCANGKPYRASRHCRYDKRLLFRGTFVFESHVGKKPLKSCFRLYGKAPLQGGKCQKLKPLSYKAYPFKVSGIRQKFAVKVTWFVKPKKGAAWKQVGASFMKVRP